VDSFEYNLKIPPCTWPFALLVLPSAPGLLCAAVKDYTAGLGSPGQHDTQCQVSLPLSFLEHIVSSTS
jgi:hypothetical protein